MRPIVACLRIARPSETAGQPRQAGGQVPYSTTYSALLQLGSRTLVPARLTQSDPPSPGPRRSRVTPRDKNRVSINHAGVRLDLVLYLLIQPFTLSRSSLAVHEAHKHNTRRASHTHAQAPHFQICAIFDKHNFIHSAGGRKLRRQDALQHDSYQASQGGDRHSPASM